MSRSRLLVALLALVLLLGAAAVLWGLPARTLLDLQRALVEGDEAALDERVDFEALREGLKHQLLDAYARASSDERLVMAASRYVGTLVDSLVTPATLASVASSDQAELAVVRARWRGLDGAEVVVRDGEGRESRWLFERRGVSLVLFGIELPKETANAMQLQWSPPRTTGDLGGAGEDIDMASKRACLKWQQNGMAILEQLRVAQRTHHAAHGRYSDDIHALGVRLVRGPDLYDFVITRADESRFVIEARGKAIMSGDALRLDGDGVHILRDSCATLTD